MKYNRIGFFIVLFIFVPFFLNGHSYKVPLVVDTDMALDDVRALIMLFNSDMADILLIVSSDGALSPSDGYGNLNGLLERFDKKGIRLAAGRDLKLPPPRWRAFSRVLFPPKKSNDKTTPGQPSKQLAANAVVEVLNASESPVVYLGLGPLTNLADALRKDSGIKKKISRLIYYGTPYDAPKLDWNTARDKDAARVVFDSGLRIYTLSPGSLQTVPFDMNLFKKIKKLNTPASRLLTEIHEKPILKKPLLDSHFQVWDEMAVIYLNRPEVFEFRQQRQNIFLLEGFKAGEISKSCVKLLGYPADSHLKEREVVVLNAFPVNVHLFKEDLQPFVEKIIRKYGLEEWKACVLTNELHRHLGIYSIVGAKMGIQAREILDAPLDSLEVTSFAGNKPPLSCMNDGLQVSTGASLGRGTIAIVDKSPAPAAAFRYKDKHVTLKLKSSVVEKIKESILAAINKYGNLTPAYFAHVRELAVRSWLEFDRKDLFETAIEE